MHITKNNINKGIVSGEKRCIPFFRGKWTVEEKRIIFFGEKGYGRFKSITLII